MIQSMTGYGKAVCGLEGGNLSIEIRTLNGKTLDLSIRSQLLPKARELEIRNQIASRLIRGTVDVYLTWQPASSVPTGIDSEKIKAYYGALSALKGELGVVGGGEELLCTAIRLSESQSFQKSEVISDDSWPLVSAGFGSCLDMVQQYRIKEGAALYKDVVARVQNILVLYDEVERLAPERVQAVRERILSASEDLSVKLDPQRFEQEMIFWLEKYDINEEKVRLRQHCRYFLETIDSEPYPGRKLGFIIQEMGREINTTGSKASHAGIQKLVVRMKDELEKIREQSMNIL